jgi:hypothetical protein
MKYQNTDKVGIQNESVTEIIQAMVMRSSKANYAMNSLLTEDQFLE